MNSLLSLKLLTALTLAALLGFGIRHLTESPPSPVNNTENSAVHGDSRAIDEILKEKESPARNQRLRDLLAGIADREIHSTLNRLSSQKNDWTLRTIEMELLVRWAATDPKSAVEWATQRKEQDRASAIVLVASTWADNNPEAALAWAGGLKNDSTNGAGRYAVLRSIAFRNAQKAIALITDRPELAKDGGWHVVFMSIAARDRPMAIAEALRLPDGANRYEALEAIASFLSMNDPRAAETWINTLPQGQARKKSMDSLIQALVYQNPKEAIRVAMATKAAGSNRNENIRQAVWHWAEKDPAAAKEWVAQLPDGDLKTKTIESLVIPWAEKDPKAALGYALEGPDAPARNRIVATALGEWLGNDFQGSLDWIDSRSEAISPEILLSAVRRLSWSTPANAVTLLDRLPDGQQRNQVYQNLADHWTGRDPWAAAAWLEKMPEGPGRDEFTKGLIRATARTDAPAAIQRLAILPEGPLKTLAATELASAWAANDPVAALEWIGESAPTASREKATQEVIGTWAKADSQAAAGWLKTLPDGALKDTAIQRFSNTTAASNPAEAAAWTLTIGDPAKRESTATRVVTRWMKQDPAAAKAWVQSAALPETWKQATLKNFSN